MSIEEATERFMSGELEIVYATEPTENSFIYCTLCPKDKKVKLATEQQIEQTVELLIKTYPEKTKQVKDKPALLGWFVGQTMKAFAGRADPRTVERVCYACILQRVN